MSEQIRTLVRFQWLPTFIEGKFIWLKKIRVLQKKVKLTSLAPEGIGSFEYYDWMDLRVIEEGLLGEYTN